MILNIAFMLCGIVTIHAQLIGQLGGQLGLGGLAGQLRHPGLIDRDALFDFDHPLADVDGLIGNSLLTSRAGGLGLDVGLTRGLGLQTGLSRGLGQTGLSRGLTHQQTHTGLTGRSNINLGGSVGLQTSLRSGTSHGLQRSSGLGLQARNNIHDTQGLSFSRSSRGRNFRTSGNLGHTSGFQGATGNSHLLSHRTGGSLSHLRRSG